jgi:hypothetical protein
MHVQQQVKLHVQTSSRHVVHCMASCCSWSAVAAQAVDTGQ